jgi:hypothetical protein
MAFQNGAALGPVDLLEQLVVFLIANGWTTDRSAIEGAGWTATLHNGAMYIHLRASVNEQTPFLNGAATLGYSIALYAGTGFSAGEAFNSQLIGTPTQWGSPLAPTGAVMTLLAIGIPNYYFFADAGGANIVVVVEKESGLYAHMGWGTSLSKLGAWTGGPYFFASSSAYYGHSAVPGMTGHDLTAACMGTAGDDAGGCCGFVFAEVDSFTGWISLAPEAIVGNGNLGYCGKVGGSSVGGPSANQQIRDQFPSYMRQSGWNNSGAYQPNLTSVIDGRANLLFCLLWAERDGTGPGYSPLGTIPYCFAFSGVGQGYSAGSNYVIGTDTYSMFPNFAVKQN